MWKSEKLRDFFANYDPTNANHLLAVDLLQKSAAGFMFDEAAWVRKFREKVTSELFGTLAVNLIKEFEGFRSEPYLCPAGVWTIGYGSTYYPDGNVITKYDSPVTNYTASQMLSHHLQHAIVPELTKTIPTWTTLNNNQKAAIIDFAYNLGAFFYGGDNFNTISKALSTKENLKDVPKALMLYVNPGSDFETGLRRRRQAEVNLWNKVG